MVIPQESLGKQLGVQPRIASQGKASQGMKSTILSPRMGLGERNQCPQRHPSPVRSPSATITPSTSTSWEPVGLWHWCDPAGTMQTLGMEPQASPPGLDLSPPIRRRGAPREGEGCTPRKEGAQGCCQRRCWHKEQPWDTAQP